jgi:DNA polymerase-4
MKKPDAVTEITKASFRDQVWPLPASELLFVGRATTDKLRRYGIHTIGDLAKSDIHFLRRLLGVNGEKLWISANGLDNSRVMPCDYEIPVKSIGHGITCTEDLVSYDEVYLVLLELSQEVGKKLRAQNLQATRVRIAVRDTTLTFRDYQGKLEFPTQSYTALAQAAFSLFKNKYAWNNNIRSLTISAIDLIADDTPVQIDLWADYSKHNRRLTLERTVDDIRRRFGLQSINFAALGTGLKIPGNREVEYKMPAAMYR